MHQNETRKPGELGFSLILLGFSVWIFYQSYTISGFSSLSSAGFLPMLSSAVMSIVSLLILIKVLRKASLGLPLGALLVRFDREVLPRTVVIFGGLVIGYMLLLNPLGFLLSSFLFLLSSIWFLHRANLLMTLIVTVGALAGVYSVFQYVFGVLLPRGSLLP